MHIRKGDSDVISNPATKRCRDNPVAPARRTDLDDVQRTHCHASYYASLILISGKELVLTCAVCKPFNMGRVAHS